MTGTATRERYQSSKRSTYSVDDLFDCRNCFAAQIERSLTTDLSPSMSTSETLCDVCDRRIDVARHGDVDDEERPIRTPRHRRATRPSSRTKCDAPVDATTTSATASASASSGISTASPKPASVDESARARHRSIRDDHAIGALLTQALDGGPSHLAGADDENRRAREAFRGVTVPPRPRRLRSKPILRRCGSARAPLLPAVSASRKSRCSVRPSEFARVRRDVRILDLPENFGFADEHRIEAGADAEEMLDRLTAEQRVEIRFDVVAGRAVTEVREKRFDLRDAALVIVELGVDLQPSAGLQHDGFAHGFVIAQRDQRLGHARCGKGVALADFDRRGTVRKPDAVDWHGVLVDAQPMGQDRHLAGEVDVAHDDRPAQVERHRREVEDRANAEIGGALRALLRGFGRNRDHGDVATLPRKRALHLRDVLHDDALPALTDDRRRAVEDCRDVKALLAGGDEGGKGAPQITEADDRDAPVMLQS